MPNPFEKMKEISKQQGVDVTNSYIMQGCHSGVKHEYQKVLLEKKNKEATFAELEWHVHIGKVETISWLNKNC